MPIQSVLQDLRYTFRILRRDAGFTTFAILIVGLGIGASSTVFSVASALLIRPLPFRDPASLVWITNRDTAGLSGRTTQVGNFLDVIRGNGTLHCNAELGCATMVAIKLAVESYRQKKTMVWDPKAERVVG